jgi:hypothetical protein
LGVSAGKHSHIHISFLRVAGDGGSGRVNLGRRYASPAPAQRPTHNDDLVVVVAEDGLDASVSLADTTRTMGWSVTAMMRSVTTLSQVAIT